jgi:hypothetical protein
VAELTELFLLADESVDERGITHRRSVLVTGCVFQGGTDIPRGTMVTFADGSQRLVESTEAVDVHTILRGCIAPGPSPVALATGIP